MRRSEIVGLIKKRRTFLCIGLDSDYAKIPDFLKRGPAAQLEFNKAIIDATRELCVSYKLNTAFYESRGSSGWDTMARTVEYIGPEHFIIADAKRGDIGNTCQQYAKAFFEEMKFDAITIAPYMGEDSVRTFLDYENKQSILLALTSNKSADDFELLSTGEKALYEEVISQSQKWKGSKRLMYVVGATRPKKLTSIRALAPDSFLLIPGVGAQGGSLEEVAKYGMTKDCGLLINSSRSVIFASRDRDFAEAAAKEAKRLCLAMSEILDQKAVL